MNKLPLLVGIILLLTTNIVRAHHTELNNNYTITDNIILANDANIEEILKLTKFTLIEFYSKTCSYCTKFAPEYVKIAKNLHEKYPDLIQFVKIEGMGDNGPASSLMKEYNVSEFPSIFLVRRTNPEDSKDSSVDVKNYEYLGELEYDELLPWVLKKSVESSLLITNKKDLDIKIRDLNNEKKSVMVLYGNPVNTNNKEIIAKTIFETVAREEDLYDFISCLSEECVKDNEAGSVSLFKKDEEIITLIPGFTTLTLTEWTHKYGNPIVSDFLGETSELLFVKKIPGIILYRDQNAPNTKEIEKLFYEVATDFRNKKESKLQFLRCDDTSTFEKKMTEFFKIEKKNMPLIKIHDAGDDKVVIRTYDFNGIMSREGLTQFCNDYVSGKLQHEQEEKEEKEQLQKDKEAEAQMSSSENTDDTDKSIVKDFGINITNDNYNQIVMDKNVDVFLAIYNKEKNSEFDQTYQKLARNLVMGKTVTMATSTDTENKFIKELKIEKTPTVLLFKKDNKSHPIEYKGEINFVEIRKFMEKELQREFDDMTEGNEKMELKDESERRQEL